ncbi:MAG: DUF4350 domain-containing protein [Anaerolineae bacterium]|nr:DUF4350 domain-containing protein [Gemmatimonadaceae bacterium]
MRTRALLATRHSITPTISRSILAALICCVLSQRAPAQQFADTSYTADVPRPAYASRGPTVLFDHAHRNLHRADGNYRTFADLLASDGYQVTPNQTLFTRESLQGFDVLIIVNARGGEGPAAFDTPAFTIDEAVAVRKWVGDGGSLLLIADHAPFGAGAEILSLQFGVNMSKGFTIDTAKGYSEDNPGLLYFTRGNSLLADHAIVSGRDSTELVSRVLTFTGQSLSVPGDAAALLKLSSTAMDAAPQTRAEAQAQAERIARLRDSLMAARAATPSAGDTAIALRLAPPERVAARQLTSAAGRAQAVALEVGKGRVVILGEAACLSAQIISIPGSPPRKMGMNVPGTDNRQFALNVMHWLSRLL